MTRAAPDVEVAIIGTGFSGLGMAIKLKEAGRHSFVLLEKADDVGGTWRDNHYPGCACDIPSHLYSFSFRQNPRWSRAYAPQPEILAYLRECADHYGLRPHIRFGAEVVHAELDEPAARWQLRTRDGQTLTARHVVAGVGALSRPALPDVPGLSRFRGKTFHSAAWDHTYDLTDKTVAVVGTGASAIQFLPRIAAKPRQLHLYQRTPPWVLPRPDRPMRGVEQRLFSWSPAAQNAYRAAIYAHMEARGFGFTVNPRVMQLAARMGRAHIRRQIRSPELRAKVTPNYTPGCKRILMADDYYPTLERDNVELHTDAITGVTERGVVTAGGGERPVDAIIFGTGFRVSDLLTPMRVLGRGGVDLNEQWQTTGIEAYLGTTIAGFPNLYTLMGPNTGLGHNSMVFMIEAQVHYALQCMREQERRGAQLADVRARAQAAFNAELQPRLSKAVWASGCSSWYLDAHGKNATIWPGFTFEYWWRTRQMRAQDYDFTRQEMEMDRTSALGPKAPIERSNQATGGPFPDFRIAAIYLKLLLSYNGIRDAT